MIGDRLAVGFLTLNQETEVRTLLPELTKVPIDAWWSKGKMRRSERLDVGSTPTRAAWKVTEVIRLDEEPVPKTGGG
jgi:hypothetical protein